MGGGGGSDDGKNFDGTEVDVTLFTRGTTVRTGDGR